MSQLEDVDVAEVDGGELPESKVLDHLGLVAGMFEELEIGDRIDEHNAQELDEREVSVGQAVSDPGSFPELIDQHVDHLQNVHGFDYVVADGALYSADHTEKLTESGVKFITRVPETISEAKTRIQETEIESMEPFTGESLTGYRRETCRSEYGGVEQRWLIVYSEEAEERARDNLEQKIQKQHEEETVSYKLTDQVFAYREDADQALKAFESDLKASERQIMAPLIVMKLCLLVCSALERRIREGLQPQDLSFPNQKGNSTQRRTAR